MDALHIIQSGCYMQVTQIRLTLSLDLYCFEFLGKR